MAPPPGNGAEQVESARLWHGRHRCGRQHRKDETMPGGKGAGPRVSRMLEARSVPGCRFVVVDDAHASGGEPLYELSGFSTVGLYGALIDRVAMEVGVDARLIRAIMYMETTHGYYDRLVSWANKNNSVLPMNVNVTYWGDVFGSRDDLKDPYKNIRAGAEMLFRIRANLPAGASVAQIATLYNNINAHVVSRYGARVQKIYGQQPWVKK
jgi:hypothetical protein